MKIIAAIREKLADIDYYSAHRPRTLWTRLIVQCFFITLALGFVVSIACHLTLARRDSLCVFSGQLFTNDKGALMCTALPDPFSTRIWEHARPYANFEVIGEKISYGWPIPTSESDVVARMDMRRVGDQTAINPQAEVDAILAYLRGSPQIEEGMRDRYALERTTLIPALASHDVSHTTRWWAIVLNALLCWPALYFLGCLLIGIAWIFNGLRSHRVQTVRQVRKSRGLCPHCKYNVDGNLASLRCPECGEPLF